MRTAVAFCLALIVGLTPAVASAAGGNGIGHAYGQGNGNDAGGNGSGNNGNGNAGDNNGNANDSGSSSSPTVLSPGGLVSGGADQNIALDAVNSGAALPLDKIEPTAVLEWGGRVIDAKLLSVSGILVYKLTIISETGVSRRVYYDARTGTSIGGR